MNFMLEHLEQKLWVLCFQKGAHLQPIVTHWSGNHGSTGNHIITEKLYWAVY
jgi:hypothetical protein